MKIVDSDYFVVGSGMAGLMSAMHLSSYGSVTLVTKGRLKDCMTTSWTVAIVFTEEGMK